MRIKKERKKRGKKMMLLYDERTQETGSSKDIFFFCLATCQAKVQINNDYLYLLRLFSFPST